MSTITVPMTMGGVLVTETGGPEVLDFQTGLPVPEPKAGEFLVKNDFIGINFIDTYFRAGLYKSDKPEILGREGEGTIVALGQDTPSGFSVGDRVVWLGTAGYAEYSAVPAATTAHIPPDLPPQHGAASLIQGVTALTLVRESHPVKAGDWVLVHAAAGGVGLWLVQILRAIGARTIGTASTNEKIELARENGAQWMINYSHEDVVERVKAITAGEGVIAVFDGVGKDTFEGDLEMLARKGSLVSYGNASGPVPPVTISRLAGKNLKLMRPQLYGYIATRAEFEHYVAELFGLMLKDGLNVRVHEVYPLQDVARAHRDLEARKTTGKLLLRPRAA
ncbi:MAG: NADPH:quinone reductase [Thelocarpon impressellum]|nr:MAG: NADPH:quinone reductase [Thelocarpon impressellum]